MWRLGLWRSLDAYLQLYADAGEAKFVADASTPYSKSPTISHVAPRIHRFAPDARILYVMRDPIERTVSHYWHMVRWQSEHRDPLTAIRRDPYYMAVSHYSEQLAPYLALFGAHRVYALTFEELVARPVETLQAVYAWLGVDAAFVPPTTEEPENVTPEVMEQARVLGWLKKLRATPFWARIAPVVPAALRAQLVNLSVRCIRPDDVSMTPVIEFLRPIQRAQTRELSRLLNRSFPEWTTLGELGDKLVRVPDALPVEHAGGQAASSAA